MNCYSSERRWKKASKAQAQQLQRLDQGFWTISGEATTHCQAVAVATSHHRIQQSTTCPFHIPSLASSSATAATKHIHPSQTTCTKNQRRTWARGAAKAARAGYPAPGCQKNRNAAERGWLPPPFEKQHKVSWAPTGHPWDHTTPCHRCQHTGALEWMKFHNTQTRLQSLVHLRCLNL